MTTVDAGRFLGRDDLGVEPGARADLMLLDADPTADVGALYRIATGVRSSHHLSRSSLAQIQERVAAYRSVG